MVVRFYEWDPNGSALGHASMTLPNGVHISWWPGEEDRATLTQWLTANSVKGVSKTMAFSPYKFTAVLFSVPASMTYPMKPNCMSSYQDDVMLEGREADRKVKLRNCLINKNSVMTWWEKAKKTEKYILTTNNCSTMVIKALKAGGVTAFEETPDYMMWTPYRAFQYCEKLANLRLKIEQ